MWEKWAIDFSEFGFGKSSCWTIFQKTIMPMSNLSWSEMSFIGQLMDSLFCHNRFMSSHFKNSKISKSSLLTQKNLLFGDENEKIRLILASYNSVGLILLSLIQAINIDTTLPPVKSTLWVLYIGQITWSESFYILETGNKIGLFFWDNLIYTETISSLSL